MGRAVVTGGSGFVGSHMCDRLLMEGHQVVCIDNLSTGSPRNVEHLRAPPGFTLRLADVSEPFDVEGDVEMVLHLASPASPTDYLEMPLATLAVGSTGTRNALRLASDKHARFLLASSSEIYGDPQTHPQPETYWGHVNPIGPRSVYDEAKRFGEAITTAYRQVHGTNTAIARIFNTYGPRMRARDGRAVPTFVRQALSGGPLPVTGDGLQTRSICYVDDLVDGLYRLLMSDLAGPVNLGNPCEVSIGELAHRVRELAGSASEIEFVPRPTDDPKIRRPDITLASTALGWLPRVDADEGLIRTISWFREHAQLDAPGLPPE